jgi:formate dehydrogenase
MIASVRDGRIVKVVPDREHPVSEGHICLKGPSMASITHDPDRVLRPLRRTGGPGAFEPVSWDEALDDIAARMKDIVAAHGSAALGIYTGNPTAFGTLHYAYAAMFVKAFGAGAKITGALHVDTGAKNLAMELVFGNGMAWTFPDIETCEFLIILGANPMISHMSLISEPRVRHRLEAIHQRGGVVVVDPRRTETARLFEHVPIRPDSDVWLLGAMLNHILAEGLEAADYLGGHANGLAELREGLAFLTPERAGRQCGVDAAAIRSLAERFAGARSAACYGRVGTCRGRYATLTNVFIEALNVVTGRFGVAGGWVTGISPIADPEATPAYPPYGSERSRIGDFPMLLGQTPSGSIADEIVTPGVGRLRAFFVDCGNPVNSYPAGDRLEAALKELELMVALDLYVTETTRHAHYILPATTFFEREDLTEMWAANAPRPWVQYTQAVVQPQGEARFEYDIYDSILERAGLPSLFAAFGTAENPRPPFIQAIDLMLQAGAYGGQDGLSLERLLDEFPHGVRVAESVDATSSWTRVHTPDRKARLWHPVIAAELVRLADEGEQTGNRLLLIGRRKLGSMNSWMHNVERLVRSDKPTLLMHPDDARDRRIVNGQRVRVSSRVAALEVEVEISDEMIAGSVSYPHGWGNRGGWARASALPGANINLLASGDPADWEQVSGNVHVDGIAVIVLPV